MTATPNQFRLIPALCALVLTTALLMGASTATAKSAPPDGFGKLKFLMSIEDAKKAEPRLAQLGEPIAPDTEAQSEVPTFTTFTLDNQTVIGIEGCNLQIRFADDQLYFIQVNCGGEPAVMDKLMETYGDPIRSVTNAHYWFGDEFAVSVNIRSRNFGYFHRKLDQGVQQALFKAINQGNPGAQ